MRLLSGIRLGVCAISLLACPALASAQAPSAPAPGTPAPMAFGVIGGISGQPKQGVIGGFIETTRLGLTRQFSLRPDVEIGFGGGAGTVITVNAEILFWLPFPNSPWSAYFGAAPMFVHSSQGGTGGAFEMLVGMQHRSGLFLEIKASGGNGPSIKGLAGFVIRR